MVEETDTPRLTPPEAMALFLSGERASFVEAFDLRDHLDEVMRIVPGMIGALLKLDDGTTGMIAPDIGITLPVIVTTVPGDYIRVFVDPDIRPYKRKGQQHVTVVGLNHKGEGIVFDTSEVPHLYPEWIAEEIITQYNRIQELLAAGHSLDAGDSHTVE